MNVFLFLLLMVTGCANPLFFTKDELNYYKDKAFRIGYENGLKDCERIKEANDDSKDNS